MSIWERMSKIDRRIIFLLVALAVIIPLIVPLGLPSKPSKYTQSLYDAVDRIPPNSQPLLISADYSPAMMPELHPMMMAIARHCFAKKIRLLVLSLDPTGISLAEDALKKTAAEYNAQYGTDYVLLGYKPGTAAVMLSIGENIRQAFPKDNYNTPLDSLPMMQNIRNYADIPLLISLAGSDIIKSWVIYAGGRYRARIGGGGTAVMTADYYPFLQSGQMVGLLNGMKGASEYEYLNEKNGYSSAPKKAGRGMDAVSIVHLLLMAFIVVGNIGYLALKKQSARAAGGNAS